MRLRLKYTVSVPMAPNALDIRLLVAEGHFSKSCQRTDIMFSGIVFTPKTRRGIVSVCLCRSGNARWMIQNHSHTSGRPWTLEQDFHALDRCTGVCAGLVVPCFVSVVA